MGEDAEDRQFGAVERHSEESLQQDQILPYFSEAQPIFSGLWEPSGIYERYEAISDLMSDDIHPLGAPPPPTLDPYEANRPRCFNCSETSHVISTCPYPLDKPLIALSRQIHEFQRQQNGDSDSPRSLRELAERLERVSWSSIFAPGTVGSELRKALRWGDRNQEDSGDDDGYGYEWLSHMALWGYPPGWVSTKDPREKMRARIMREPETPTEDADDESEDMIKIWGENGEEDVVLAMPTVDAGLSSNTKEPETQFSHPRRWAHYPRAYFAWECLTIYNGVLLSQRDADADRVVPSILPTPRNTAPPPPSSSPPPLPPSLPEWINSNNDGEEEMDLSD